MSSPLRLSLQLLLSGFVALLTAMSAQARVDAPHPAFDPHLIYVSSVGGTIDITHAWLLHQGDEAEYASPSLNDSNWTVVTSDGPPLSSYGLKDVDRIWYRTHLRIPRDAHNLGIYLHSVNGSLDVYANGLKIGSSGDFRPGGEVFDQSTYVFAIPDSALGSDSLTIALRTSLGRATGLGTADTGFGSDAVVQVGDIRDVTEIASLRHYRMYSSNFVSIGLELIILIVSLGAALTFRTQQEYFALAFLTITVIALGIQSVTTGLFNLPVTFGIILLSATTLAFNWFFYSEFYRLLFKLRRSRLLVAYQIALALTVFAWEWFTYLPAGPGVSPGMFLTLQTLSEIVKVPSNLGPLVLAVWAWRKRRDSDASLLIFPLTLQTAMFYAYYFASALTLLHLASPNLIGTPPVSSFYVQWGEIVSIVYGVMFLIFLISRTLRVAGSRAKIAAEIEAARSVQQILLAGTSESVHGLAIETTYYPASEVGGDFFQIIPHLTDGSTLVVAGDVTGKGLQAGMLVAVLIGAIRTTAEYTMDPKAVLETLNRRLLGRSEAFATCLALRIESIGMDAASVTLANAGHLAPYLNGIEVPMEGALPLGMIPEADFPVSKFQFAGGDTLTLISDGILEAQDKKGQLFGFERVRELLRTNIDAAGLAAAAQAFGQEDDISLISIVRA